MPRLVGLVPTLDRADDLVEMAGTLVRQTVPVDELVVVDAGRPGDLAERLRAVLDPAGIALRYLRSEPGTSLQRNVAMDALARDPTPPDFLLLLDDDVLLEPDYVERSLEPFDLDLDPPVGGVLATFTSPARTRGWQQHWFRLFGMTHSVPGDEAAVTPSGGVRWLVEPSRVVPVPVASGGRTTYRWEAVASERFDEFLPGYALAEDVEFSYRVAKRWTLVHTPHARLFHKRSPSARVDYGDRAGRLVYSRWWFFRKHSPKDPRHLAAFAWTNLGILGFYGGVGLLRTPAGQRRQVLRGVARGYRRIARDLRKRPPEEAP